MKSKAVIDAGICGFQTIVEAICEDCQNVSIKIDTTCKTIKSFAHNIEGKQIDAYQEISKNNDSVIFTAAHVCTGCCKGFIVPVGIFKVLQVAAGLALPKDVAIKITKD